MFAKGYCSILFTSGRGRCTAAVETAAAASVQLTTPPKLKRPASALTGAAQPQAKHPGAALSLASAAAPTGKGCCCCCGPGPHGNLADALTKPSAHQPLQNAINPDANPRGVRPPYEGSRHERGASRPDAGASKKRKESRSSSHPLPRVLVSTRPTPSRETRDNSARQVGHHPFGPARLPEERRAFHHTRHRGALPDPGGFPLRGCAELFVFISISHRAHDLPLGPEPHLPEPG